MTIKWIWQQNKSQAGKVAALSFLGVLNSIFGVLFALLLKLVIDAAVARDIVAFHQSSLYALTLVTGMIIVRFFLCYLEEYARTCAENSLRHKMFDVMLTRDYASITSFHTGELMNRLTSDITLVTNSFVSLVPALVSMIVRLICIIVVMMFLDWRFSLVFLIGGIFMILCSLVLRRKMKWYHTKMQESSGRIRSFIQEALESIIVIRAFSAKEQIEKQADKKMLDYKKLRMKKNHFSNISHTGFSMLMNIGYLFGIIWCGYGILQGTMTYGTLLAVQQLISQLQLPISNISAIIPQYYSMTASAERLMEFDMMVSESEAFASSFKADAVSSINSNAIISASNLTMSYDEEADNILENAFFSVNRGEFVAITGASGIGKSTLIKLLLGLYPLKQGNIIFNCNYNNSYNNNYDTDYDTNPDTNTNPDYNKSVQIRNMFAYVPQGNMLMSGTIKQIITMFQNEQTTGQFDEQRIKQACRIACADSFIESLPEGYNTMLGEKGNGLSEGQMQRIAIARAIYYDAPVLLLDEATSALDERTELQVLENIKNLTDKTVLIITHRTAAFKYCDRKITLKDKKITEVIDI